MATDFSFNALRLDKGGETWIFLFTDAARTETLRTLGRFASNPDLAFSWHDAAVLSQQVRAAAQLPPPRFKV